MLSNKVNKTIFIWIKCQAILLLLLKIDNLFKKSCVVEATADNPDLTFDSLYTNGMTSYLENNWASCISYLELALEDWIWWNDNIIRCRRRCYNDASSSQTIFPNSEEYKNDIFFEKMVINTLCLVKCKKKIFGQRMDTTIPSEVLADFESKKPYDYLQLCYFKHGQLDKAANAAATFLTTQPNHEVMQQNLKYYVKKAGLDIGNIINLEMKDYAKKYIEGDKAYMEERYLETTNLLEESLTLYYEAWTDCRLACENPFDQGWYPDFVSSVANHFTFTLRCKNKCRSKLSNLYGEEMNDFVASIFNYLQYSYYQVGNLEKACEAIETVLVLDPDDPAQIQNKQFYWTQDGAKLEYFTPRKDVVEYKKRNDLEKKLIKFIEESFTIIPETSQHDRDPGSVESTPDIPGFDTSEGIEEKATKLSEKMKAVQYLKTASKLKIRLVADETKLKGTERFLAAGFLTHYECDTLTRFIQMASVEGDGYSKRKNPHTASELFQGVTLGRAAMVVLSGYTAPIVLETILNASEFSKTYLERYFRLEKPLYFSFTHLVCRTSVTDPTSRNLSDMSHVMHADNCILQKNGDCLKIPPAYTFRDYSALLYLNNEFEGGEFIFSNDQAGEDKTIIQPQCGYLVGFSAGKENVHGVKSVLRGTRCALAMWFTFDQKHHEVERSLAEELLSNIKTGKIVPISPS